MASRKNLRSVPDGETPTATVKPLTVEQAAKSGDHRALLVAMRERIAKAVSDPACPPRDLAALTRRLQDIANEIAALDLRAKEEGVDAKDVAEDEAWNPEAL